MRHFVGKITFVVTLGLGLTSSLLMALYGHDVEPPSAYAASLQVCPSGCAYTSIQAAVDAANEGDVIKVAAGIYTGVNNYEGLSQVVYLSKTVMIQGGYTSAFQEPPDPVANPTTLDAQGQGRVFYIAGNISPTIEGLRLTGGDAMGLGGEEFGGDAGGGIYVLSATAYIRNNRIFSNTALYGAGLYLSGAAAALRANTITSNTANIYGGGVYLNYSDAVLTGNQIIENVSGNAGGGLYVHYSEAHIEGNTILSNISMFGSGGGVFLYYSPATLNSNTVSGNAVSANHSGGGLLLFNSPATLVGNLVQTNTAHSGAGVYLESSAATLIGNIVRANKGIGINPQGGGLGLFNSTATISANVIASNTATFGGGMTIGSGSVVTGNLVLSNTAYFGGGVYVSFGGATLSNNWIQANIGFEGGGLYVAGEALLADNVVISNAAGFGGGLLLGSSDATLINSVIIGNRAEDAGSGLFVTTYGIDPPLRLIHSTIARNYDGDGSGVHVTDVDEGNFLTLAMTNTVIAEQAVGISATAGNKVIVNGVLWSGNAANTGGAGTIFVENAYSGSPVFATDGYHLTAGSAAHDRGIEAGVTADIDGEPRPMGLAPDLGADELPIGLLAAQSASPNLVRPSSILTYTLRVTNTSAIDLHATITDVLPTHVMPSGILTWTPVITAPGGAWTQQFTVTVQVGYSGTLTNTLRVTSIEGASADNVLTSQSRGNPQVEIAQSIDPDPVEAGAPLTYTLRVSNTGDVDLHATITDILPSQVTPMGTLTWTPIITAPGGVWTQQVKVTAIAGYSGTLTNTLQVTTREGVSGGNTLIASVIQPGYSIYLPVVLRQ